MLSVTRRRGNRLDSGVQVPATSLVQGRGTSDCRCEHEPQIRFSPRSLPGGSNIDPVGRRHQWSRSMIASPVWTCTVTASGVLSSTRPQGRCSPREGALHHYDRWLSVLERGWLSERPTGRDGGHRRDWKPVVYSFENRFAVWLCNARAVKKVRSQVRSLRCRVVADVAAHGMVRPNFVPPPPIQSFASNPVSQDADRRQGRRDPTAREGLQDAGIKLTSVASKVLTQSGCAMIEGLTRASAQRNSPRWPRARCDPRSQR